MDKKIKQTFYEKNKSKLISTVVLLSIVLSFGLYGMDTIGSLKIDSEKVQIYTVSRGEFQEFIPVDANITPSKTIYLDVVAGGQVEEVYVEDGKTLQKGEPNIEAFQIRIYYLT